MRILALTWTTFDNETLMINSRGDLICPAVDGITNELLELGHQVVYVNVAAEEYTFTEQELACPAMISGLPYYLWKNVKRRDFDLIWHCIKDPTPPKAIPHVERITAEFEGVPVLNHVKHMKDHNKRKYITCMREKNVGAIILDDYEWPMVGPNPDPEKVYPPSQACYVAKDLYHIRVPLQNSQRFHSLFSPEGGITLRYHDTSRRPDAIANLRSFFRVPYAGGKCLEGWLYYCPVDVLCPKSGAAISKVPFSIDDMAAGSTTAAMTELGVDLAHLEGVQAGFTVEIFDVNPFPSSHGASLTPLSKRIAKRLEQVYDV